MGPRFESVKVHQWPVGQVVKTAASHAVNIGSNPVRVTTLEQSPLRCGRVECVKHSPRAALRSLAPPHSVEPAGLGFAARGTKEIVLDKGVVGCYY